MERSSQATPPANDGAAALIIASEQMAAAQGPTPRARIAAMATAGVEPRLMGLGPVPATRRVLERAADIHDMDVIELNEAFAAQALGVYANWGCLDDALTTLNSQRRRYRLRPSIGNEGARLALAASHELHRRNGR